MGLAFPRQYPYEHQLVTLFACYQFLTSYFININKRENTLITNLWSAELKKTSETCIFVLFWPVYIIIFYRILLAAAPCPGRVCWFSDSLQGRRV